MDICIEELTWSISAGSGVAQTSQLPWPRKSYAAIRFLQEPRGIVTRSH